MTKRNDDFFREKKAWSKVKDELLECYLTPYIAKILTTKKPLVYVDCFAGKESSMTVMLGRRLLH